MWYIIMNVITILEICSVNFRADYFYDKFLFLVKQHKVWIQRLGYLLI